MAKIYLTTAQAAAQLGVPEAAIRNWKTRKRIVPADVIRGSGRGGLVPLWDLEELRPLAVRYLAIVSTRRGKS